MPQEKQGQILREQGGNGDSYDEQDTMPAKMWKMAQCYSRRINIQHRLVYQVLRKEKIVKVLRLWTQYE